MQNHHSSDDVSERFQKILEDNFGEKLGATGKFPEGKLSDSDEGQIKFAVTHDGRGKVILHFGKPIMWIGMGIDQAREFARLVREYANKLEKEISDGR